MGFKTTYADIDNGGIKPAGEYKCRIVSIEEKTARSGNKGLNITYEIIRGQKYGGGMIFDTIWKRKEPTEQDKAVGGYMFDRLMRVGKAAQLQDGKDYPNLNAYLNDLLGRTMIVVLKHESDPNFRNGEPQERVHYLKPCGDSTAPQATADEIGSIDDFDDVPF